MKLQLIPNWMRSHRMGSMRMMGGAQALIRGWLAIPREWQEKVPVEWVATAAFVALLFGMAGRVFRQASVENYDDEPEPTKPSAEQQQ